MPPSSLKRMVAKPRSRKEYNNRMNAARTVAKLRAAFFCLSFPSRHPCFPFPRGRKSLFHAFETTVSYVWNNCFMHLKQLFHALETVGTLDFATGISWFKTDYTLMQTHRFPIAFMIYGKQQNRFYKSASMGGGISLFFLDGFAPLSPSVLLFILSRSPLRNWMGNKACGTTQRIHCKLIV